ncbi:MAG: hypothetical protein DRH11_18175 [Deltaproteobacteria bacterium]|nr:MAG: hypothetical protein DRH11_18175 [Deltaproteobacteria bacterium]
MTPHLSRPRPGILPAKKKNILDFRLNEDYQDGSVVGPLLAPVVGRERCVPQIHSTAPGAQIKMGLSSEAHLIQHPSPSCQFIPKILPLFYLKYSDNLYLHADPGM